MLEGSLTGLNVIRQIRALTGRAGKIPILAISGFDDVPRRVEMLRSGANDFVKPVVPEEFSPGQQPHPASPGTGLPGRSTRHPLRNGHARPPDIRQHNRHYINERTQTLIRERKHRASHSP